VIASWTSFGFVALCALVSPRADASRASSHHELDGIAAKAARPALTNEATFGVGSVLVHYATSGVDAPPTADTNTNGVPDFVEEVATTADDALVQLVALGFRRPVDDGGMGGDTRIDFYLRNLQAADGNASTDTCTTTACSAFATVENDYAGYNYSSITEAIRSVVPHELFHLVQYAYATEHVVQWAEGTAVWAVEHLFGAGNSDFERFLPSFLSKTFRPFERPTLGFGDNYPYGAALWPLFLEQRFDAALLVDAWERCANAPWLDAIEGALAARGRSLDEAWIEFTRWNGATGAHVVTGAYADARAWPEAPREPVFALGDAMLETTIYIEGRSARYIPIVVDKPRTLDITSKSDIAARFAPTGAAITDGIDLEPGTGGVVLEAGVYSLIVTGLSEGTIATAVTIAPPVVGGDDGCSSSPASGLPIAILVLAAIPRRRRRRVLPALVMLVATSTAVAQPAEKPLTDEELAKLAEEAAEDEVIVITGTKSETPRAASPVTTEVIDRERIQESGVQTVSEALSLRPGIWVDRGINGDQGVSLQGLSPQYTLILVDGARQIGRTDGVLDLDRFSLEDIERIEIVRGPSSVLYGSDALGGVINLVTRTPKNGIGGDLVLRLDSRLGREGRGRVAGGRGTFAGAITGSYRKADAIRIDDDGTRLATSIDAYEDAHATAHGIYRHSDRWRADASADYVQRDLRGIDTQTTGAIFDRRNVVETASGSASTTYAGENTAFRAEAATSFYRDQYLLDQRMSTALDAYQITDEMLFEGRAQIARQRGRHRGLVGAEVMHETLESPRLSSSGDRTRAALFAQDEWKIGKDYQVLVVPAARLDVDTQFGTHATPRLAARWEVAEGAVLRGSVGMGYRAPSFKELLLLFQNPGAGYVVEGNPELDPETSFSVQLGGEWRVNKWLWLGADAYLNRLRDMIFAVSLPSEMPDMLRFTYDNIGRARTAGGELYTIATHGRASLELGYALNLTRDLDADRPLEGLPRHRFTATTRFRDKSDRLEGFLAAVITGGRPFFRSADPQDATYTDTRVELRARVGKRFTNGLGAFLGCDNILDAGDNELDRVTPRTLYVGMEAHL
jgi:outer membrane receptor for ferrienterochelin and colicins